MGIKPRLAPLAILLTTGMLVLAAPYAPAQAQYCPNGSSSRWCSRWESGQCLQWSALCNPAPHSSAPAPRYGAIAYGPTSQAWGYSDHWGTQRQAESTALKNCGQHGSDCEVAVWFEEKCGAVVSDAGTSYYWGLGDSAAQAVANARTSCAKDGGTICQQQVAQCSQ